jgi:hypothetical protein
VLGTAIAKRNQRARQRAKGVKFRKAIGFIG